MVIHRLARSYGRKADATNTKTMTKSSRIWSTSWPIFILIAYGLHYKPQISWMPDVHYMLDLKQQVLWLAEMETASKIDRLIAAYNTFGHKSTFPALIGGLRSFCFGVQCGEEKSSCHWLYDLVDKLHTSCLILTYLLKLTTALFLCSDISLSRKDRRRNLDTKKERSLSTCTRVNKMGRNSDCQSGRPVFLSCVT